MQKRLKPFIGLVTAALSGCAAEMAPDVAPSPNEKVDAVTQANLALAPLAAAAAPVPTAFAACVVTPKSLNAPVGRLCASDMADGQIKKVSAIAAPETFPSDNALYSWKALNVDGAGNPSDEGCKNGIGCTFTVKPRCGKDVQVFALTVEIRDRTRPSAGVIEKAVLGAIVPDNATCPANCTAPPANSPSTTIFSERCGGLHRIVTGPSPGAAHIQIQTRPRHVAWSDISDLYTFPGITADIGPEAGCSGDANGDFFARSRACNDCGCTAWGQEALFFFFTGECS